MSLLIRKPGIFSTIQDLGRFGARRFGINPSGAMDAVAARLSNIALGNREDAPVLEMHFPAAEIEFENGVTFALGGADFQATIGNTHVPLWKTRRAEKGDRLRFRRRVAGYVTYLATAGGFEIDEWLGSASTNLTVRAGGHNGRKLISGDRLHLVHENRSVSRMIGRSIIPRYCRFPTVRIIAGAEFELLTALSERALLNSSFSVSSESNRMGFRLHGEQLNLLHSKQMLSSAVERGTIQLLPDGQLIVLMADHQTTGGYPRVGQIIIDDLPLVAQLGPKDQISFHLVTLAEAEAAALRFERDLALLRAAISLGETK